MAELKIEELKWINDHQELARLARWMDAEGYAFPRILSMLEKPWNWFDEYQQMNEEALCGG